MVLVRCACHIRDFQCNYWTIILSIWIHASVCFVYGRTKAKDWVKYMAYLQYNCEGIAIDHLYMALQRHHRV